MDKVIKMFTEFYGLQSPVSIVPLTVLRGIFASPILWMELVQY